MMKSMYEIAKLSKKYDRALERVYVKLVTESICT